jgi:probable rRNA maturation factor
VPEAAPFHVVLLDKQRHRLSALRLRRGLAVAARALRVRGELTLVFCGDARIRTLNRRYRGKDKPTDVLSFSGPGADEGVGDVVISVPAARRNARRLRRGLPEELEVLALHGFLHTLGYDHETDDGTMERLEARLRRRLGLAP